MISENQTIPNYEVHCGKCGWWGHESQLKTMRTYDLLLNDVAFEPCCPSCLSWNYLEYKEYDEQNIGRLEKALTNLEYTTKQFNQAMENLHCQISLRQS